jgi:hypothetical protein
LKTSDDAPLSVSLTNFAGFLDLGADVTVPFGEADSLVAFVGFAAFNAFEDLGETGNLVELGGLVGLVGLVEEPAAEEIAALVDLERMAGLAGLEAVASLVGLVAAVALSVDFLAFAPEWLALLLFMVDIFI